MCSIFEPQGKIIPDCIIYILMTTLGGRQMVRAGNCCCPGLAVRPDVYDNNINNPCGSTVPLNYDNIIANRASTNPVGFGNRYVDPIPPSSPLYTPSINQYTGVYQRYNGNPLSRPRNFTGSSFLEFDSTAVANRAFNNHCNLAARYTSNDMRSYRGINYNGSRFGDPSIGYGRLTGCRSCCGGAPYALDLPYGADIPFLIDAPYGAGTVYTANTPCAIAPVPNVVNYGPVSYDSYNIYNGSVGPGVFPYY
ncbi:hypothetical protein QLL95_gp0650 [Cotonvirus japonicus]|uniref:Uncharacterized protein n=1 Tax=Cotonvirus japonicus TaxID=2811091 RepID=A0ABM7NTH6_9VIRU|nr:hypothetical protein QLL95_gp0650 [Cotonvirus japonicus]BCS83473.1 hypothetical protein [Cotonvirus japonicus]